MNENNNEFHDSLNDNDPFFDSPLDLDSSLEMPLNTPEGYSLEEDDDDDENELKLSKKGRQGNHNFDEGDEDHDDEEEDEEEDNEEYGDRGKNGGENGGGKSYPTIRLLFEMMINPIEGWKKIRRTKSTPEETARGCFYPILAIAAASCFMECIYNSTTTLSMAMIEAVKIFVSLFFGNFLALTFVKMLMPKDQKKIADTVFGKKYMMYLLSTLGLFWTLFELLPMIGPVLSFTPLWTIYLAMRGARFFRFPEEKSSMLTAVMCGIVVAAPYVVFWVFDMLLPAGNA